MNKKNILKNTTKLALVKWDDNEVTPYSVHKHCINTNSLFGGVYFIELKNAEKYYNEQLNLKGVI